LTCINIVSLSIPFSLFFFLILFKQRCFCYLLSVDNTPNLIFVPETSVYFHFGSLLAENERRGGRIRRRLLLVRRHQDLETPEK